MSIGMNTGLVGSGKGMKVPALTGDRASRRSSSGKGFSAYRPFCFGRTTRKSRRGQRPSSKDGCVNRVKKTPRAMWNGVNTPG